jgi:hypothetical protein
MTLVRERAESESDGQEREGEGDGDNEERKNEDECGGNCGMRRKGEVGAHSGGGERGRRISSSFGIVLEPGYLRTFRHCWCHIIDVVCLCLLWELVGGSKKPEGNIVSGWVLWDALSGLGLVTAVGGSWGQCRKVIVLP